MLKLQGLDLLWVHGNALRQNLVAQKVNSGLCKLALFVFCEEIVLSQVLEYLSYVGPVFFG